MNGASRLRPGGPAGRPRGISPSIAVGGGIVVAVVVLLAVAWTSSAWILLPAALVVACLALFGLLGYRTERDLDDACDEIEHDRDAE